MKTQYLFLIPIFFLSFLLTTDAQNKNKDFKIVTGTVADSNFKPLKGVWIYIDSIKTNIQTNRKGIYKIKSKSDINFISAYSKNHGLLTVDYSGAKEVDFVFSAKSKKVSKEELVRLGFKNPIRKKSSKVDFEGLDGVNAFENIYEMINGRVSGVTVTGQNISIRGASTLDRGRGISTEPLFLVNGSTVTSITHIVPSDVKSIEVIKGPETAYYGSRGVYGVIKITLKN